MKSETLNSMLRAHIRDCADRKPPRNIDEFRQRKDADMRVLRKSLCLSPEPPRTPLNAQLIKSSAREGYVIDVVSFESRRGWPVYGYVYRPAGDAKVPVVVQATEIWPNQAREPWVQARGVSMALAGIATLIVIPPGRFGSLVEPSERGALGNPDDAWAQASAPWMGLYAWDLVRATDFLAEQPYTDVARLGIAGDGMAGMAAWYAFALEERFKSIAALFDAESWLHVPPSHDRWSSVPGLFALGDVSDILTLRAPAPVFIASTSEGVGNVGGQTTFDELKARYKLHKAEDKLRFETFHGEPDVNRRVREAVLAFFKETLAGEPKRFFYPEARPITDGRLNPYAAWTDPADYPELLFWSGDPATTIADLIKLGMEEAYPEDASADSRLVPWGRYGRIELPKTGPVVRLQDDSIPDPAPDVVVLPTGALDEASLIHCGLSRAEFLAQLLHLSLPGIPEGWESAAMGGDPLSSMIASVKTLMGKHEAEPPTRIEGSGALSSAVTQYLKLLRPEIEITVTHAWNGWTALKDEAPFLAEPGARYRRFPFS